MGQEYQIRFQPAEDSYAGIVDGTDEIRVITDDGLEDFFDRSDFIVREGLCGDSEYISLESKLYPNKFWRHQNYIIKLHDKSDENIFKLDGCFKIVKHRCTLNYVSESVTFESKNFPDRYITKCGNQLKIQQDNEDCGDFGNKCWVMDANLIQIVPTLKSGSVITANKDDHNVHLGKNDGSYNIHLLSQFRQIEGFSGNHTITFESHGRPGEYLYTDDSPFHLKVGPKKDTGKFSKWASWLILNDTNGLSCEHPSVSLASVLNPEYFLAYCKNELMLLLKTGTWTRCKNEENFDLHKNGCWNLNSYRDKYMVDLFSSEGDHGPKWIEEQVQYKPEDENFELWFVAESGTSDPESWGDIAIDDISGYYGECLQRSVCTFEDSKDCGFSQDQDDLSDWTIGSYVSDPTGSAPPVDHTSHGQVGKTVYYQNDLSSNTSFQSRILTPSYDAFDQGCVSFWYYMWSTEYQSEMELSVMIEDYTLFSRQGWMKQGWVKANIDVVGIEKMQLVFQASGKNIQGKRITIAFDDYEIDMNSFCNDRDSLSCDFETKDTCGWINNEDDDIDWIIGNAGTDTSDTGPGADHTTQTNLGYYLYISEQSEETRNKYAVIQSPIMETNATDPSCFTFWYHMYGKDIGNFMVNKVDTRTQDKSTLFSKFGSQTNHWNYGEVQMEANGMHEFYFLEMIAVTNLGEKGNIAVDDLFYQENECYNPTPVNFTCSQDQQIPMNKRCDFILDCENGKDEINCGKCDFESNLCGWTKPYIPSKFAWQRKRNGSDSGNGPSIDHTTGSEKGWYMIAQKTEEQDVLTETILLSPMLMQSFTTCELDFWIYMEKDSEDTRFEVSAQIGTEPQSIFWRDYDKHLEWTFTRVTLGRQRMPFWLLLTAFPSEGDSVIAIDDLHYANCDFPKPAENCDEGRFICNNKACIDIEDVCDHSDDCGDNSDEIACDNFNSCNFEDGSMGSWENIDEDSGMLFCLF